MPLIAYLGIYNTS